MTRQCAWCQRKFTPVCSEHVFCCHGHKDLARQARRQYELLYQGRCERPFKRVFATPGEAHRFAEVNGWVGQHPYLCTCACWHLTSKH